MSREFRSPKIFKILTTLNGRKKTWESSMSLRHPVLPLHMAYMNLPFVKYTDARTCTPKTTFSSPSNSYKNEKTYIRFSDVV